MKKLLLILICLPLLFSSCQKTECNCGDIIDTGNIEIDQSSILFLVVENECTDNIDTLFVSETVFNYYNPKRRYCSGAW